VRGDDSSGVCPRRQASSRRARHDAFDAQQNEVAFDPPATGAGGARVAQLDVVFSIAGQRVGGRLREDSVGPGAQPRAWR